MNEINDNPPDLLWRIAETNAQLAKIKEEQLRKSWKRLEAIMEKGRRSPIPRRMAKLLRLLLWLGILIFSLSFVGLVATRWWVFMVTGTAAMIFMIWASIEISNEK